MITLSDLFYSDAWITISRFFAFIAQEEAFYAFIFHKGLTLRLKMLL